MAKAETTAAKAEDAEAAADTTTPVIEPTPDPEPAEEAPSLARPESLGLAKVKHPEGATSVTHNCQTYTADSDGIITVPNEAVVPLAAHGFVQA